MRVAIIKIIARIILVSACILLAYLPVYGGGKKIMEPLYKLNEALALKPETYKPGCNLTHLFPVLMNGTQYLATNDVNRAITILSFREGKLRQEAYFINAHSNISVSPTIIQPISDSIFGFGQVRAFTIFDLKKNTFKRFRICYSLEDDIRGIAIADAEKKHFIFEINSYDKNSNDYKDKTTYLRLYDLSGNDEKLIKEIVIGKGVLWISACGKNFLHDFDAGKLNVLDMNLETAKHELVDSIKRNKAKIDFIRFYLHPYQPFAILTGGNNGPVYLSWRIDDKILRLFKRVKQFSYSPDGKWVIFLEDDLDDKKMYLMPISEKYPNYLGSPILLLNYELNDYSSGWTTNPLSFVGANRDNIYRWEFTKEAQKSMMGNDFDKYPTFHDWIVAKDLEKLTKEKKQGLGK